MKRFRVTQQFDAPSDVVHAAYCKQETWERFGGLPFVGDPVIESFVTGDPTTIAMRYRISVDLPALASSFIDAKKLTFVEITTLHDDGTGSFEIQPDHYSHLFESAGGIDLASLDDGRCERVVHGHVDVTLGWTGKMLEAPVEDVIVNGLKKALAAQALQVPLG